jgi:MoaA/NifB/PqqE/SkfB family radical SAM enzyme
MVIENDLRIMAKQHVPEGGSFADFEAPLFMAWQLNQECNIECLHCCEEAGHFMPDSLNSNEVADFCEQITSMKIPYVAISGGEPMLHKDFYKICEYFRKHNISLKAETNGLFVTKEKAKWFGSLGFRSVQVSVDGATAEAHEKLRIKGKWQPTIDACKYLVEAGVTTEIVFVPTKFNIHETGQLIDMAHKMGIYGVYTGKTMRIGRAADNWDALCPTDAQYEEFFKVLKEKQASYEGEMKVFYYPYDVIEELKYRLEYPSASLLVIPNGKVKLIGPMPFLCGDLRKHTLAEIWERYKKAWKDPKVVAFAKKVVADPTMVAKANDWVELYS